MKNSFSLLGDKPRISSGKNFRTKIEQLLYFRTDYLFQFHRRQQQQQQI